MGVILSSYESLRCKIIKNIKNKLVVESCDRFAKICPSIVLSWCLQKIIDSVGSNLDFKKLKLVIKFGFDGAESLQELNFQNENESVNDKYFFLLDLFPYYFLIIMKVYCGKIQIQILQKIFFP